MIDSIVTLRQFFRQARARIGFLMECVSMSRRVISTIDIVKCSINSSELFCVDALLNRQVKLGYQSCYVQGSWSKTDNPYTEYTMCPIKRLNAVKPPKCPSNHCCRSCECDVPNHFKNLKLWTREAISRGILHRRERPSLGCEHREYWRPPAGRSPKLW